jgi:tRNA(Ile2) C34 agmatinyltransferase TiaS
VSERICKQCGGRGVRKGRVYCDMCIREAREYAKHWFVRSLVFNVPRITPPRTRKPLKGQTELF